MFWLAMNKPALWPTVMLGLAVKPSVAYLITGPHLCNIITQMG